MAFFKIVLILCPFILIFTQPLMAQHHDRVFQIVWWNVENLFDTANDPLTNDDDFTPDGSKNWTRKRLDHKLNQLAKVINDIKASHPQKQYPEIFGFCEVEHPELLDRLFTDILKTSGYKLAYRHSSDRRGIDIGFVYNASHLKLIECAQIPYVVHGKTGREIMFVKFSLDNVDLAIYGNHWPSRRMSRNRTERWRIAAAQALKRHVDSLMQTDPALDILIMGDFNDEPHNISLSKTLNAAPYFQWKDQLPPNTLLNCFDHHSPIGTYIFQNHWKTFDQIIIHKNLTDSSKFEYVMGSASIFYKPYMFELMKGGRVLGMLKTYNGNIYKGGISDHLPVSIVLRYIHP